MKNLLLIFILCLNVTILSAQGLQLLGHADLPSGQEGSGLWGYTSPSGREYAICGQTNGIAIYEVTSGTPVFKIQLPQASGIWHEVKHLEIMRTLFKQLRLRRCWQRFNDN